MTSQPPFCPLCKERCGRFLCPCCGMHAAMPWKCDLCQPHTEPCMIVMNGYPETEKSVWLGCTCLILYLVVIISVAVGAVVLAYRAIT